MRISFVLSSLQRSGGVALVMEYANRLAVRGWQVYLVVPGASIDAELCAELHPGVKLCGSKVNLSDRRSPFAMLTLAMSLVRAIPRSDVLVATHTPTVVPVSIASRLSRKGRRVWLYMDYAEMFQGRRIERWLLHTAPRWFEMIATISNPLSQHLMGKTAAAVVMTGSGVRRSDLFRPVSQHTRSQSGPRVLYLGDDRPRKGMAEFLKAAETILPDVPGVRFIIASKRECAIDIHIPHQFYLNPSDQQLAELYQSSDLLVSASWGEGLGYPPLEAMACGTPVVLSDSEGVRDYARDGENCLLVPSRDPRALAVAMTRVLSDTQLAQRIAHNGLLTAQRYDWEKSVDRFETALASLS